ncbi:carbohydrate binding domain-containing protein [Solihabitans fulvus]|uniref:carbohydrate binding domain-containing protein n=1 Tax=Solihabitans fulvus TaxID=1892852 RepID=UPI0016620044|nr:carbohydrate binding domain-containing protein [Solihabitans fulvus]
MAHRWLRALVAFAVASATAVTLTGTADADSNLLANPGFETGDLTGWSCAAGSVVNAPVHTGAHALAGAVTSGDTAQCTQTVGVRPNTKYTISGWVRGSYVYLGATGTGGTDPQLWTPGATDYQQLSGTFTTGASTTAVTLYVHGWYAQGAYDADDLALTGPGGTVTVPPTPTGLAATGTTASSVSLTWAASAGATGYTVYRGGAKAASVTGTSATVTGLAASTAYSFTVSAGNSAGESAQSAAVSVTTSATGGGGGGGGFSHPAYFMPLDGSPQQVNDIIAAGEKELNLAFVLDSGGCTPAWGGLASTPVSGDTTVLADVAAIRAAGGDVAVSFGGYNGTELGSTCGSAGSLAAAYQKVIDKYALRHVDFDYENGSLDSNTAVRFGAIKILEQNNPTLSVSLTIPMTTVGLPGSGQDEIRQAVANGARLDIVNIMDFDFGLIGSTQVSADETIANDVVAQLQSIYGWDAPTVWSHLGLQLMNGHTDQPSELFTQNDFTQLLAFAQRNKVGWFSYWDVNRDRACDPNTQHNWADPACSSVPQNPYDFTKILVQYGN